MKKLIKVVALAGIMAAVTTSASLACSVPPPVCNPTNCCDKPCKSPEKCPPPPVVYCPPPCPPKVVICEIFTYFCK